MPGLFTPLTIRDRTFPNRAWVSPMCQYSAHDGVVGDWHLVHLGSLAAGRAGLIMSEATAVVPEGRISPHCPGLWNDEQQQAWARIVDYVHGQNALFGFQLAHAGRKASVAAPWEGGRFLESADGGWLAMAPSAVAFAGMPEPLSMAVSDIERTIDGFAASAARALELAGDGLGHEAVPDGGLRLDRIGQPRRGELAAQRVHVRADRAARVAVR